MFISLLISATIIVTPVTHVPQVAQSKDYKIAHSKEAQDWKGFEPSLYTGKWFSPRHNKVRKCIMQRESRHNYRAANKTSSARGAYQFLDNSWRVPLTHMMIAESKQTNDGLIPQIKDLRNKPIHKWNRYYQDRAFWTAWRFGKGAHHWHATVPGTSC
jgi:hypothetical protein